MNVLKFMSKMNNYNNIIKKYYLIQIYKYFSKSE